MSNSYDKVSIAFFDAKEYDRRFFDAENQKYHFNIRYFSDRLDVQNCDLAEKSQVVCAFVNDDLNCKVLEQLKKYHIKLIAMRCAGYNNVDLKCILNQIPLVRVPAYSPYAVAEYALAMILTLNRKTSRAYFRTKDNNFSLNGLLGFDLHGKTVGIIGTGAIGKVFARIMHGIGMNILLYDKFDDPDFAREVKGKYVPLDMILKRSDIISLHCPLTSETKHMINAQTIAKMKPNVMLVNTSRGQLVDTVALIDALKESKIGAAALDVYEEETGYFFEDLSDKVMKDDVLARLTTFNNVLITSHQAFFTKEAMENIAATTLSNISDFIDGRPLKNEICYKCEFAPVSAKKK